MQQQQQQQSASNTNSSSSSSAAAASAHLATVLQSQSAAAVRAQAAAVSAMLMPSMPVHHSSMGQAFNMMHYAQAVAGMMQQQQSQQQAQSHRNPPAPPPPPPPLSQAHASASSTLDSLLRANGIHTDHHRFIIIMIFLILDSDNLYLFFIKASSRIILEYGDESFSLFQQPITSNWSGTRQ